MFVCIYAALVESRNIPIKPALYADDPVCGNTTVLFEHPNSDIYNIASKVVDNATVDDVKANVNLYLESGNLFQSTKKYLLATLVPVPTSENKIKLYISPFIV